MKKFAELTADFDEVDVAWILNFERLQQQVYMYSDDDRSAYYPNDLDWPIVWALARYNKKHIICTKKLPGLLDVNKDICRFLDKVKWRWIHKDNESELPVVRVKHKRRVDNPCHLITTPLLQCWCDSVRQKILAECKQSINKSKHNRSFHNFKKLIKWGTQRLKNWVSGFYLQTKMEAMH